MDDLSNYEISYVERLKNFNIFLLCCAREVRDIVFYYECTKNLVDIDIGNFSTVVSVYFKYFIFLFFIIPVDTLGLGRSQPFWPSNFVGPNKVVLKFFSLFSLDKEARHVPDVDSQ